MLWRKIRVLLFLAAIGLTLIHPLYYPEKYSISDKPPQYTNGGEKINWVEERGGNGKNNNGYFNFLLNVPSTFVGESPRIKTTTEDNGNTERGSSTLFRSIAEYIGSSTSLLRQEFRRKRVRTKN